MLIQKQQFPYSGVMALAGAVKQAGHQFEVLIDACEPDLISSLKALRPDVIGFSVMSIEHKWLRETVRQIRMIFPPVPIIVGGVHAIMYPREIMELPGVDYVCCGEGEIVFPQLLQRLAAGQTSAEGLGGVWYHEGQTPIDQGVTELISDLDTIYEDRSVYYDKYTQLKNLSQKFFMSSRGCPFHCAFCCNAYLMDIFKGKGKYIRRKSVKHFVEEIKRVKEQYGVSSAFFCDDLFILDLKWLEEFKDLYKSEVNTHFICTGRAGAITAEHARVLAEAGCHTVSIGLETGNESLRKKVLKKNVSDRDIRQCANNLYQYGIELQTNNMFGFPGETVADAVSTIDFNLEIKTKYMATSVFMPFPKTELSDYCIKNGLLDEKYSFEDMPQSFITTSVLNIPGKHYFENLQKVSHLCLTFPFAKNLLIKLATNVENRHLFFLFYLLGTFLRYKKERKLTFLQNLKYLWTYRKGY
ncbi:MAG: radical SAM protein [Thermodesulfobacteriota bacterium]